MIRPVSLNNIESKAFTSGYDIETKGLLKSTEQIFDAFSASDIGDTVIISRECGDLDLVKNVGGKSVGLSKFGDGNILLQVVDNSTEVVDVFYHNVSDEMNDRVLKYKDTKLFPWNKGQDVRISCKPVRLMNAEDKSLLEAMCKKYIPEFLNSVEQLATKILKKPL